MRKLSLSYSQVGGEEPLIGLPIYTFLREEAETWMRREAVVFVHQGVRLTYAELFEKVDEVAAGLYALGVQRGDRVGIWATDNLEWLLLQIATVYAGALYRLNPLDQPGVELGKRLTYGLLGREGAERPSMEEPDPAWIL